MPRLLKQIIIALIFFIIVGSIGLIIYSASLEKSSEPSPTPEVSIPPPQIISQRLLKIGDLDPERSREGSQRASTSYGVDYDFLAEIKNPNLEFGATDVFYELNLFNQNNQSVAVKRGIINLLPGQTRYEVISPITASEEIFHSEFKITGAQWRRLKEFIPQNLFLVKNQESMFLPGRSGSWLRATLFNDSNFDFDRVDIHIVLFDENNNILAVNRTDVRTFLAKTARFFEVRWPYSISGRVRRVEVNAYTDVFKNENFIKEHGTQEKFQKFY